MSIEAKDLICRLLCDVEHRLGTGGAYQIKVSFNWLDNQALAGKYIFLISATERRCLFQAHPWFKDVMWDRLYEMEAAFKPEVNGELDTQNFMKFDEVFSRDLYYSST